MCMYCNDHDDCINDIMYVGGSGQSNYIEYRGGSDCTDITSPA